MPTQRRIARTLREIEEELATLRAINEEQDAEWSTAWAESWNRNRNICLDAEVDPDDIW